MVSDDSNILDRRRQTWAWKEELSQLERRRGELIDSEVCHVRTLGFGTLIIYDRMGHVCPMCFKHFKPTSVVFVR